MLKHCKITEIRTQRFVGLMLAGAIALLAGGAAEAADETFVVDFKEEGELNLLSALGKLLSKGE